MKKMLVMEFNELCPPLVERFINDGDLPNFKKLREVSEVSETETDATGELLNPWVQWVDVHSGMDWPDHNVRQLNDVSNSDIEFTWDILAKKHDIKSWICGSMNGAHKDGFKGLFLPDPWSTDIPVVGDKSLETYYEFVSQSVQSHSGKVKVSAPEFLYSLVKQGVQLKTIIGLIKQIVHEKFNDNVKWKRAMWLDRIQLDVFCSNYKKSTPRFSTFFSNAVAHFQHHYWADFEPEKFGKNEKTISKATEHAIRAAYKNTDYVVGELLKLVGPDTSIIFATALSQEPYTKNKRYYYNIKNYSEFFEKFSICSSVKVKPLMAEQFLLELGNEKQARELMDRLNSFEMDSGDYFHVGSNLLFLVSQNNNELLVQCRCTKQVPTSASFHNVNNPNITTPFHELFYEMKETKTGVHNPIGLYWKKGLTAQTSTDTSRVKPSQIHYDILEYFE